MTVKRCAVCNVRMSKGHKKGPKPVTCSRAACKKKWYGMHRTLDISRPSWHTVTLINTLYKQNPDAWEDYFDIE